jgi:hypothetical protein
VLFDGAESSALVTTYSIIGGSGSGPQNEREDVQQEK